MTEFIQYLNGEEQMRKLLFRLNARTQFCLSMGSTETSDVAGISAAGATPEFRRLTPAADAEALVFGHTLSVDKLPVSPLGVVSPVVITRACLNLAGLIPHIVNCGAFVVPRVPFLGVGTAPAAAISTGRAMPPDLVCALFSRGYEFGLQRSRETDSIVMAECVPGGTTTALGVLIALGYDARRALSGSIPNCNHDMRLELVEEGLRNASLQPGEGDPIAILAALGDPMQPFVAGMALSAGKHIAVILAGGSQMLAVYALCKAFAPMYDIQIKDSAIGIVTTKWVAFDEHARVPHLSEEIDAPMAAACPDFNLSRHPGLQLYERGNVKEGVGAGAAMVLAYNALQGDTAAMMNAIDQSYDEMVRYPCSEAIS